MPQRIFPALALLLLTPTALAEDKVANRCGWFDNPSPGNATLEDRDGSWDIGIQGGHQAEGNWPEFKAEDKKQFARAGRGSYGHGCACLRVSVDREEMRITKIVSAKVKPLADCRRDPKLKEPAGS
jgi:hypothetical protein